MIQQLEPAPQQSTFEGTVKANFGATERKSGRSFSEIISDYWSDTDRGSALDYLKGLNRSELQTISREHGFADPNPNLYGLNIEGANNLLREKGKTIDENRDGIDQIGEARSWRFPNSNTPANVAAAWKETTDSLDGSDEMLLAGALFLPLPLIETDATGRITKVISPGEPGYRDRTLSPNYSYRNTVENKLRALDDPSNPPANIEFYNKAKTFYTKLLESFNRCGVK